MTTSKIIEFKNRYNDYKTYLLDNHMNVISDAFGLMEPISSQEQILHSLVKEDGSLPYSFPHLLPTPQDEIPSIDLLLEHANESGNNQKWYSATDELELGKIIKHYKKRINKNAFLDIYTKTNIVDISRIFSTYEFIFSHLLYTNTFCKEKTENVIRWATQLDFSENMLADWQAAVTYILHGSTINENCSLDCNTDEGKLFFLYKPYIFPHLPIEYLIKIYEKIYLGIGRIADLGTESIQYTIKLLAYHHLTLEENADYEAIKKYTSTEDWLGLKQWLFDRSEQLKFRLNKAR